MLNTWNENKKSENWNSQLLSCLDFIRKMFRKFIQNPSFVTLLLELRLCVSKGTRLIYMVAVNVLAMAYT